jgi:hypothetical protein
VVVGENIMLPELRESKLYQSRMYRNVQKMVTTSVSSRIPHSTLAKDIANSVLLSFIKEDAQVANLQSWVSTKIEQATETHMSDLWQYCFSYALMLLKNEEDAQEISQMVMIALLKSQQPVTFVKAWLKSAVNKQAMLYLKLKNRDSALYASLVNEIKTQREPAPTNDEELDKRLNDKMLRKLLSKEDYLTYTDIKSHKSLKTFAQANGISYPKARETKHRIYTNLRASYLKKQGWADTPDILDYRQMVNIKRFLETLLTHAISGDFSRVFHYADKAMKPKLAQSFGGFQEISDWGIQMNPNGSFDVYVIDVTDEDYPITVNLTITLNKANYIKIVDCSSLQLLGIISEELLGPLPLEKGRCTLSLDQLRSFL